MSKINNNSISSVSLSSSSSCLDLLRHYLRNLSSAGSLSNILNIDSLNHLITIGSNHQFPSKTRTPYKSISTNKFFELDSIVFLILNEKLKLSEYLSLCKEKNITPIPFTERKQLLDYVRGIIENSNRIDQTQLNQLESHERKHIITNNDNNTNNDLISSNNASKRLKTGENSMQVVENNSINKPINEWDYNDIISNEQQLSSRTSVLQSKKSFSSALQTFDRIQMELAKIREKTNINKNSRSNSNINKSLTTVTINPSATQQLSFRFKTGELGVPIIVLPAAVSSIITLINVHEFLQQGQFINGADKRSSGTKKPDSVNIERSSYYDKTKTVRYHCIDDVGKLKSNDDWERVVAVFVSGATWQFDNWPKNLFNTPQQIFENIAAFHVYFDDEILNKNIAQWRVHKLPISRTKRYQDRGIVTEFWNTTQEFTAARNNKKRLQI